jgi:hypothetical protein
MSAKNTDPDDERNRSFDLPDAALEKLKPGVVYEGVPGEGQPPAHGVETHHRLSRRDRKDIPETSLAERIRKAQREA